MMTFDEFIKPFEKDIDSLLQERVKKIVADMNRINRMAIQIFYEGYTPHVYERTYGLYMGIIGLSGFGPKIEKLKVKDGRGYRITYNYSPDFISRHEGKEDVIFNGPFEQGYHGGPDSKYGRRFGAPPIAQTVPSPWEMIRDYAVKKYEATVDYDD